MQPSAATVSKQLVGMIEALEQQLARKDGVIAKKDEVIAWATEEHIKLKYTWGALNGAMWVQPDIRDAVVDFTTECSAKTELPAD